MGARVTGPVLIGVESDNVIGSHTKVLVNNSFKPAKSIYYLLLDSTGTHAHIIESSSTTVNSTSLFQTLLKGGVERLGVTNARPRLT